MKTGKLERPVEGSIRSSGPAAAARFVCEAVKSHRVQGLGLQESFARSAAEEALMRTWTGAARFVHIGMRYVDSMSG